MQATTLLNREELTMLEQVGWPYELLEAPSRQPCYVSTAAAFINELLVGDHLDEVVVLRNGVHLLGLEENTCIPGEVIGALTGKDSVLHFLDALGEGCLATLQANVEFGDPVSGVQRDVLEAAEHAGIWPCCATEVAANASSDAAEADMSPADVLAEEIVGTCGLQCKRDAAAALIENGQADGAAMYICEMRWLHPRPRLLPGETTTSCSTKHCRDVLGSFSCCTLMWSYDDDGLFVGGCLSGKGLHIDQRPESNIGKNWRGHKIFAVWPAGASSDRVLEEFYGEVFRPPLDARRLRALSSARRVLLLRPGDVFLFNGGAAHTTLCVSDGLGLTGYEGFLSSAMPHVWQFRNSCASFAGAWREVADLWDAEVADRLVQLPGRVQAALNANHCACEVLSEDEVACLSQSVLHHLAVCAQVEQCPGRRSRQSGRRAFASKTRKIPSWRQVLRTQRLRRDSRRIGRAA